MPTIKEHNVQTGEIIEREMTNEEIANLPQTKQSTPNLAGDE